MTTNRTYPLTLCLCLFTAVTFAAEPAPSIESAKPAPPVNLQAFPPEITLNSGRDFQGFIAVVTREDGITTDVTDDVQWKLRDGEFATLDQHKLTPLADGETELVGRYRGSHVTVPVKVSGATTMPAISFDRDVMPVLTRSGCNTGSCHGAARGKDGFNLSLFGFDPDGDYQRITREMGTRRINLAIPEQSLLIRKAIGAVPHTGGKLFETDSEYFATILQWLANEAPADHADAKPPAVSSLAIYPNQAVLEGEGTTQRFITIATYADGTTRDVTSLAAFNSNNSGTAAIDGDGLVTGGARGEAFVTARFDTHTVGSQVLALPADLQYESPETEFLDTSNYVDPLVNKKLQQLRILPSDRCSDAEFIRRVTIDIAGQMPTEEELVRFVADPADDKRAALIDGLLNRKEFSEIWAMKFAQLLMIKSTNQVSYKSAFLYSKWLTEQFEANVPLDELVRELLTSTGGTFATPATNFYEIEPDTLKTSENVAQVFLGIRTQCAQCHNHPFDRWTMNDYYGFAAFFAQVGRKQAEDYREKIVFNRGGGETKHPISGQNVPPKFLGGEAPDTKGKDRREVLSQWLTAADNPYFAKSIANRVWEHFMGVGLVDEVDDIRVSNPPSNPELFDTLGQKFVDYKFDFRALVRDICNSDAYQRSSQTNESNAHDHRNYAHAVIRRIPSENLLDCLSQVTESEEKFRGLPIGARAVQIADGTTSTYFLTTFGRSARTTVCACEATTEPSLSQALHLLNGSAVHNKIQSGNLIKTWFEDQAIPPEQVINRVYRRSLARDPSPEEKSELLKIVEDSDDKVAALQDAFWAVLNSREFVFNH